MSGEATVGEVLVGVRVGCVLLRWVVVVKTRRRVVRWRAFIVVVGVKEEGVKEGGSSMRDGTQFFYGWARSFAVDVGNVVFYFPFFILFFWLILEEWGGAERWEGG